MGAVVENLEFDPERLRAFLGKQLGQSGGMELTRIGGGQSNPTFFLSFAGNRMVLRKKPAGPILRGAHAVDREFQVLSALANTDVPVPKPILYHEDPDIVGTPFYLMERLEGRVFHDTSLPGLSRNQRRGIYLAIAETLAKLHAVEPKKVGLEDYGRPGNYFERQLARWSRQWEESPTEGIPALDELADWLSRNLPVDDGRSAIVHGDYRLGNLLFHPTESKVIGILDWELSTLGHPLADLGFCCMPWHTSPDEYGGILGYDHEALGIPSQDEFLDSYFRYVQLRGYLLPFHIAFALFRFAVIFVGIADRARIGNASGENAAELAPLARQFAVRALELAKACGD
ncbi:MAG: phosphotransferase family protein [Hyphomicrobiales bacterium]|nr:phosphotransferase family protein [Hyphomicrobiales bacterium]